MVSHHGRGRETTGGAGGGGGCGNGSRTDIRKSVVYLLTHALSCMSGNPSMCIGPQCNSVLHCRVRTTHLDTRLRREHQMVAVMWVMEQTRPITTIESFSRMKVPFIY